MGSGGMSHVFISYSREDQAYARQLADALLAAGFDVWIDDQIDYGEDWWRTIVRAIRGAKAFVAVMSDDSDASNWVQREVTLADKHKIPAFPLWLSGDVDNSENWAIYVRTHHADVRGGKLPGDDFYRRLEKAAPRKTTGRNITPPPSPLPVHGEGERDTPTSTLPRIQGRESNTATSELNLMPPDMSGILPPPFEWCEIPAGQVMIEYSESDQKTFDVPIFWMAKYPITNGQYQVFLDAKDGYADPRWWGYSYDAESWRRSFPNSELSHHVNPDCPREMISWFDSIAFCTWLKNKTRRKINLPTEQKWQRAAQGNDNRLYPWGDEFDVTLCTSIEGPIKQTTPVNMYPNGASPYGVYDLSGNVWEWCLTDETRRNDFLTGTQMRIIRGGSFDNRRHSLHVTLRNQYYPYHPSYNIGFRIICK